MSEVAPTQTQQKLPETALLEGFLSHLELERLTAAHEVSFDPREFRFLLRGQVELAV